MKRIDGFDGIGRLFAPNNGQSAPPANTNATSVDANQNLIGRDAKLMEAANYGSFMKQKVLAAFNASQPVAAQSAGFSKEASVTKTGGKIVIDAGAGDDQIGITQDAKTGSVTVVIGAESQTFSGTDKDNLVIKAGDGNDTVTVAAGVSVKLTIEGGDGNDKLAGGSGDDTISGGDGRDYINGSKGKDTLAGGVGNDVIYGGDDDDAIDGGDGEDYLEGSKGNDTIAGGKGKDILSGGLGDDALKGGDGDDVLYAGAGKDSIAGERGNNKVFAQKEDTIEANAKGVANTVVTVELSKAVGTSVTVQGSAEFKERVEADLEMLRSSPVGRQMLKAYDDANTKSKVTVKIIEQTIIKDGNYADWSNRTKPSSPQPRLDAKTEKLGTPNDATIGYAPSKTEAGSRERPPSVGLFHEMAHAYDFTHGTLQNGVYDGKDVADKKSPLAQDVNNLERVAVGLPIDDDNNPKTPEKPDKNHPASLTENALRDEMNLPKRPSYR